jgi:Protein kinase domain/AAA ATPase domain
MADVYEAVHLGTDRKVALKLLRRSDDPRLRTQTLQLFEREFMTLAQVSHPRIVAAHDFGIDPEHGPFYAMELLDGGDLHERAPVPFREACSIGRDIGSALAFLHSRRLLYRDLSPRNVRCTASGAAKLIDFGAMTPVGIPHETLGTAPFVAPEVLQQQPLDQRTDLYSLGATLYYALTGKQAFPARSMAQLWELWRTSPPAPSSFAPDIPAGVDQLVMQLLQLDPAQRPASAAEVMQRLESLGGLSSGEHLLVQEAYMVAPKLVGRERELRKASSALSAARSGTANGTLVLGDPGVGRSRFLEECALRAKVEGVIALQVAPSEGDNSEYALLRTIAKALLQVAPEIASNAAGPELRALGHVIPELGQRWPVDTSLSHLAVNERHERLQNAACRWLAAVARQQPLCIVVDDARRADAPSLALFRQLLHDHAHSQFQLIWSMTREEQAAANLPTVLLLLERSSTILTLPRLSTEEIQEFLSSIFGEVPNLEQLAPYVESTASGNPRDSLRLLQHLVSERFIVHDGGSWSLPAQLDSSELPSSMVQALAQRIVKLSPSARLLAVAFAAEPNERLSLEECRFLAGEANLLPDLLQSLEAGVIVRGDFGYRLAQAGFARVLTGSVSASEVTAQHQRLASVFERRGDGMRAAKHALLAGDLEAGLDILIRASIDSRARTDTDLGRFFDEMRALPADWLALYRRALQLCEELNRPARDREALLTRLGGFIPLANNANAIEGFAVLLAHIDQLMRQVGLDLYAALPETLDAGTRIGTALKQAKQRFDQSPPQQRVYEPVQAIGPLTTTLLAALGLLSVTNDVHDHSQLPSLGPLAPLSPALWIVEKTREGLGARIEGRFETAGKIYETVLERLSRADRGGLRPAEHMSTLLRVNLSAGTLEACMGLSGAEERAKLVCSEPDFETQGLMLRHLCELWQGKLSAAAVTKRAVEHRLAFARTRNNYDGQYLLGQLTALAMLDDLTGLRHMLEAAKRLAALHSNWIPVVHFCQAELSRVRGAPDAALESVEQALALIGGPRTHQIWANVAAAHVRLLVELERYDEAIEHGMVYLRSAEELGLGYLAHCIRIPLSQALCRADAQSARIMADAALEGFRAIGSTGLNLVLALENRARIALETEGPAAFEHFATMSSTENALVSARMRRALRYGRAEPVADVASTPVSELASEIRSVLNSGTGLGESMHRVVGILTHRTAARGGVLYARIGTNLKRIAWSGDVPHLDELDVWARVYFEGQVTAQDASTSALDNLPEVVPAAYGIPEGMYVPRLLGHEETSGYFHTGLLVLAMPTVSHVTWLDPVGDQLSRTILSASE